MKIPLRVLLVAAAFLPLSLRAETATTDPVGFISVTVPAASDFAIGVPLHRTSEFQGVIQSISGTTVTIAGTPGWTNNQYVFSSPSQLKTYFLRVDSGPKEGLCAKISANDVSAVTLTLDAGDDLSGILTNANNNGAGDLISIIPYWTPSALFSGVPSGTQLLLYPTNTAGTNFAPSAIYGFNGTNWFSGLTNVSHAALGSSQGIVVRNNSAGAVAISVTGSVPMTPHRMLLRTLASNTKQDIRFFYNSPIPEVIGTVGLGQAAGDQLLAFNNAATGQNKAPSQILSWNGSAWFSGLTNVTNTFTLQPGTSYIFRKNQTASPQTSVWMDVQTYLNQNP